MASVAGGTTQQTLSTSNSSYTNSNFVQDITHSVITGSNINSGTLSGGVYTSGIFQNGTINNCTITNSTLIGEVATAAGSLVTTTTNQYVNISSAPPITNQVLMSTSNTSAIWSNFTDSNFEIVGSIDASKSTKFDLTNQITNTALTLSSQISTNRIQSFQDATDTFIYRNTTDVLTNKTLTNPIINGATFNNMITNNLGITGAGSFTTGGNTITPTYQTIPNGYFIKDLANNAYLIFNTTTGGLGITIGQNTSILGNINVMGITTTSKLTTPTILFNNTMAITDQLNTSYMSFQSSSTNGNHISFIQPVSFTGSVAFGSAPILNAIINNSTINAATLNGGIVLNGGINGSGNVSITGNISATNLTIDSIYFQGLNDSIVLQSSDIASLNITDTVGNNYITFDTQNKLIQINQTLDVGNITLSGIINGGILNGNNLNSSTITGINNLTGSINGTGSISLSGNISSTSCAITTFTCNGDATLKNNLIFGSGIQSIQIPSNTLSFINSLNQIFLVFNNTSGSVDISKPINSNHLLNINNGVSYNSSQPFIINSTNLDIMDSANNSYILINPINPSITINQPLSLNSATTLNSTITGGIIIGSELKNITLTGSMVGNGFISTTSTIGTSYITINKNNILFTTNSLTGSGNTNGIIIPTNFLWDFVDTNNNNYFEINSGVSKSITFNQPLNFYQSISISNGILTGTITGGVYSGIGLSGVNTISGSLSNGSISINGNTLKFTNNNNISPIILFDSSSATALTLSDSSGIGYISINSVSKDISINQHITATNGGTLTNFDLIGNTTVDNITVNGTLNITGNETITGSLISSSLLNTPIMFTQYGNITIPHALSNAFSIIDNFPNSNTYITFDTVNIAINMVRPLNLNAGGTIVGTITGGTFQNITLSGELILSANVTASGSIITTSYITSHIINTTTINTGVGSQIVMGSTLSFIDTINPANTYMYFTTPNTATPSIYSMTISTPTLNWTGVNNLVISNSNSNLINITGGFINGVYTNSTINGPTTLNGVLSGAASINISGSITTIGDITSKNTYTSGIYYTSTGILSIKNGFANALIITDSKYNNYITFNTLLSQILVSQPIIFNGSATFSGSISGGQYSNIVLSSTNINSGILTNTGSISGSGTIESDQSVIIGSSNPVSITNNFGQNLTNNSNVISIPTSQALSLVINDSLLTPYMKFDTLNKFITMSQSLHINSPIVNFTGIMYGGTFNGVTLSMSTNNTGSFGGTGTVNGSTISTQSTTLNSTGSIVFTTTSNIQIITSNASSFIIADRLNTYISIDTLGQAINLQQPVNITSGTLNGILTGGTYTGVTLAGNITNTATISGGTLSTFVLTGSITASGATIISPILSSPTLTGTIPSTGATIDGVTISNGSLSGSINASSAIISGGKFSGIIIAGTIYASTATLNSPIINNLTLTGNISAGIATVYGLTLDNSILIGTTTATNSTITGGTFNGIILSGVVTATAATITGGTFSGSILSGTITATNSTITGGTFNGITLSGATTLSGPLTATSHITTNSTIGTSTITFDSNYNMIIPSNTIDAFSLTDGVNSYISINSNSSFISINRKVYITNDINMGGNVINGTYISSIISSPTITGSATLTNTTLNGGTYNSPNIIGTSIFAGTITATTATIHNGNFSNPIVTNGSFSTPTIINGSLSSPIINNGSFTGINTIPGTINLTGTINNTGNINNTGGTIAHGTISNITITTSTFTGGVISGSISGSGATISGATLSGATLNGSITITGTVSNSSTGTFTGINTFSNVTNINNTLNLNNLSLANGVISFSNHTLGGNNLLIPTGGTSSVSNVFCIKDTATTSNIYLACANNVLHFPSLMNIENGLTFNGVGQSITIPNGVTNALNIIDSGYIRYIHFDTVGMIVHLDQNTGITGTLTTTGNTTIGGILNVSTISPSTSLSITTPVTGTSFNTSGICVNSTDITYTGIGKVILPPSITNVYEITDGTNVYMSIDTNTKIVTFPQTVVLSMAINGETLNNTTIGGSSSFTGTITNTSTITGGIYSSPTINGSTTINGDVNNTGSISGVGTISTTNLTMNSNYINYGIAGYITFPSTTASSFVLKDSLNNNFVIIDTSVMSIRFNQSSIFTKTIISNGVFNNIGGISGIGNISTTNSLSTTSTTIGASTIAFAAAETLKIPINTTNALQITDGVNTYLKINSGNNLGIGYDSLNNILFTSTGVSNTIPSSKPFAYEITDGVNIYQTIASGTSNTIGYNSSNSTVYTPTSMTSKIYVNSTMAYSITDGINTYISIHTNTALPVLTFGYATSNNMIFTGSTSFLQKIAPASTTAFKITDGTNIYCNINTGVSSSFGYGTKSQMIYSNTSTTTNFTTALHIKDTVSNIYQTITSGISNIIGYNTLNTLTFNSTTGSILTIPNNQPSAFEIIDGANQYLQIVTTTTSNQIHIGSTSISNLGIYINLNSTITGTSFQIYDGTDTYIKIVGGTSAISIGNSTGVITINGASSTIQSTITLKNSGIFIPAGVGTSIGNVSNYIYTGSPTLSSNVYMTPAIPSSTQLAIAPSTQSVMMINGDGTNLTSTSLTAKWVDLANINRAANIGSYYEVPSTTDARLITLSQIHLWDSTSTKTSIAYVRATSAATGAFNTDLNYGNLFFNTSTISFNPYSGSGTKYNTVLPIGCAFSFHEIGYTYRITASSFRYSTDTSYNDKILVLMQISSTSATGIYYNIIMHRSVGTVESISHLNAVFRDTTPDASTFRYYILVQLDNNSDNNSHNNSDNNSHNNSDNNSHNNSHNNSDNNSHNNSDTSGYSYRGMPNGASGAIGALTAIPSWGSHFNIERIA